MKKCSNCKNKLSLENFSTDRSRKDGFSHICKNCRVGKNKSFRKKNRNFLLEIKKLGCSFCTEKNPVCIDFHHKNEDTKVDGIAIMKKSYGFSKLKTEIEKCILVCANCHRKIHAKQLVIPENFQSNFSNNWPLI